MKILDKSSLEWNLVADGTRVTQEFVFFKINRFKLICNAGPLSMVLSGKTYNINTKIS
jgi:hypothetical protein